MASVAEGKAYRLIAYTKQAPQLGSPLLIYQYSSHRLIV